MKKKNKVLLCYYKHGGYFFLPVGNIDFGESLDETIYRGIYDETNIKKDKIRIDGFRGIAENIYSDKHTIDLLFNITLLDEKIETQKDYNIEFFWKDVDELEKLNIRPEILKEIVKDDDTNHFANFEI